MGTKIMEIVQSGTERMAEPTQVFVAEGEKIEFVNAGSGGTLLVLTPETEGILSPKPSSPVLISSGATVTYTFLNPTGTGYLAQVLPEGIEPQPVHGPSTDGPVLTILPSTNRGDIPTGRG